MRLFVLALLGLVALPARAQIEPVGSRCDSCPYDIGSLTPFRDWLYFVANQSGYGKELWRTDGVEMERLEPVPSPSVGSFPRRLTVLGDWLYFTAYPNSTTGRGLWRTDGSAMEHVTDLFPDGDEALLGAGDWLYLAAEDYTGYQLWRTNGVQTERLADQLGEPVYTHSLHDYFDGWLYFARVVDGYRELWRTDWTTLEPLGLHSPEPLSFDSAVLGEWLYLTAIDASGKHLWRTNGSVFERVTDFGPSFIGSLPHHLTVLDAWLYFVALSEDDPWVPMTLWRTRGAEAEPVPGIICPTGLLTPHDGWLYIAASNDPGDCNARSLWRTRDLEVESVADFRFISYSRLSTSNLLYFAADDWTHGMELWTTDGTVTAMLQDLALGAMGSNPHGFTVYSGSIYFVASTPEHHMALWRTGVAPVATEPLPVQEEGVLSVPFPNPVRGRATLTLRTPATQRVTVVVHDVLGRRVATLLEGTVQGGQAHVLTFDASSLPAGSYFVRLSGTTSSATHPITVLR